MTSEKNTQSKRDAIVQQAYQVFYQQGFQAACVDDLLEGTGISKRTMYKYFRSKEDLIMATIDHYQRGTFETLASELTKRAKDPKKKILAIFDIKKEALENGDYQGCFAINAKLEYEGKKPDIEQKCTHFMDNVQVMIRDLCQQAGIKNATHISTQIMILLNGAIVYGQAMRDPKIMSTAKNMAVLVLQAAV